MDSNQPDKPHRGWYRTRHLPHRDEPYVTQNITFRLYDSLPRAITHQLHHELKTNPNLTIPQRVKIESHLDQGYGACYLHNHEVAKMVVNAFRFYDQQRYDLVAWVIMPNHVHVLIHSKEGYPLPQIVGDWKSYTAHQANLLLQRKGKFWQPGYFDRFIRNDNHFANAIDYIHDNPRAAGLVSLATEWQHSSIHDWLSGE